MEPNLMEIVERALASYPKEVELTITWLTSRHVDGISSYSLKHIIERELKTYISNEVAITAALVVGAKLIWIRNTPNFRIWKKVRI